MGKYVDLETVRVIAHDYLCVQQDEDAFMSEIEGASTSDVALVRHGTWKKVKIPPAVYNLHGFECSVCGYVDETSHGVSGTPFSYCPTCGAKMDAGA